jgi:hypothetical protein
MPAFKIDKFYGLAPRLNPLAAGHSRAKFALDVDLDNGTLRPWRTPKLIHESGLGTVLSFACIGDCWLTFPGCVSIVHPYIPSCPFVILAGPGLPYPQIATTADACLGDFCRLGLPCPPTAPRMDFTPVAANKKTAARAYRYSYVNRYGQEGGGSLPSEVLNVEDGQTVTVSNFATPDPEWCVTAIRIYRLGTPFETGLENSNPQNTEYYFVAEIPATQTSFVDTIKDIALGGDGRANVFTNDEWLPPPADLHSIVSLENGILAGIAGEYIYLTDPMSPHAWNLRYIKGLLDRPLALAAVGNALYALTDGRPYFIDGRNNPKQDGFAQVLRTRVPIPVVSPRSVAADSNVVYYASTAGLAAISGKEVKLISQSLLSERDWQELRPNTMIGAVRAGYYHGYTSNAGVRFRGPEAEFANIGQISYTNLSERPTALWAGDNGELYYADGGNIMGWNLGDRMRDYFWASTEEYFSRRSGLTSASIDRGVPGNLRFRLETDYGIVLDRTVNKTQDFRTRGLSNALFASAWFNGTAEVRQVAIGSSIILRINAEGAGRAAA